MLFSIVFEILPVIIYKWQLWSWASLECVLGSFCPKNVINPICFIVVSGQHYRSNQRTSAFILEAIGVFLYNCFPKNMEKESDHIYIFSILHSKMIYFKDPYINCSTVSVLNTLWLASTNIISPSSFSHTEVMYPGQTSSLKKSSGISDMVIFIS